MENQFFYPINQIRGFTLIGIVVEFPRY